MAYLPKLSSSAVLSTVNVNAMASCSCTHAVDLGCSNQYRDAPFHRLNNCFFPILAAFEQAARNHGCVHAESLVAAPFAAAFLQAVHARSRAQVITHALRRNSTTPPTWTCDGHAIPRATQNQPRVTSRLLLSYMRAHAFVDAAEGRSYSVLVQRERTRRFMDDVGILRQLQSQGQRWMVYRGVEPVLTTLRMFGGASAVVGYHGAGLLNVVFSRADRPRLHELSTFRDLNSTIRWRAYIGKIARSWRGLTHATVQFVPLRQVLAANRIVTAKTVVSDKVIKHLRWVRLASADQRAISCYLSRSPVRENSSSIQVCERS